MTPPAQLGAFAAALVLVLAGGFGVGRTVGPLDVDPPAATHDEPAHDEPAHDDAPPPAPGGLAVSQDGYTLQIARATLAVGVTVPFGFAVIGPDGHPLTRYSPTHERDLHLVVVRRDGTGFQHVHPTRDATGRWTVPLRLPTAGTYKVFADFTPQGRERPVVLAADVAVPGQVAAADVPATARTSTVDGYEVQLAGDLVPGTSSRLTLTVRRDGRPVTDLQPYLGALGHLVALRGGDLAYLHVHPDEAADGLVFFAEVPTAGAYRLFLDFRHGDVVRTAAFSLPAGER